jgi:hypothetical protein
VRGSASQEINLWGNTAQVSRDMPDLR